MSVSKPELRGESVVVVRAAKQMRSALIAVGGVGRGGATKVLFRQKGEVVQALPLGSAVP